MFEYKEEKEEQKELSEEEIDEKLKKLEQEIERLQNEQNKLKIFETKDLRDFPNKFKKFNILKERGRELMDEYNKLLKIKSSLKSKE